MLEELYDNFQKFSRSEVQHFHKLDQQWKVPKENECSRPTKYSKSRGSTMNFDTSHKQIHNIDSDGCGPPENWEKNFGPLHL
jgi:ribosomal protein L32E